MSIFGITISKKSTTEKTSKKIESVSMEIDKLKIELAGLSDCEAEYQKKVELLKSILANKKENLEFYYDSCDEKKEAIENFIQEEKKYKQHVEEYETKLNSTQNILKSITHDLSEKEEHYAQLRKRKERIVQKISHLDDAVQKEKQRKKQKDDTYYVLESEVQELDFKLAESEKDFADLKRTHDEAEERLTTFRKELNEKRDSYCTVSAELENLRKKEIYVKESIESVENELQESSQQITIARAELDQEKNYLEEKQLLLNEKKEVETNNQIKLNNLGQALVRAKEDLSLVELEYSSTEDKNKSFSQRELEVENAISDTKTKKKISMHSLQEAKRELDAAKSRYGQKETRLEELTRWVEDIEEERVVLVTDLRNQTQRLAEVETQASILEKTYKDVKEDKKTGEQQLNELRSKKLEYINEIEKLSTQVLNCQALIDKNEISHNELELEVDRYKDEVIESQNQVNGLEEDIVQKTKLINETKTLLTEGQTRLLALKEEVQSLTREATSLENEISGFKEIRSNENKLSNDLNKQHHNLSKSKKSLEEKKNELVEKVTKLTKSNEQLQLQLVELKDLESQSKEDVTRNTNTLGILQKSKEELKLETKKIKASLSRDKETLSNLEVEKNRVAISSKENKKYLRNLEGEVAAAKENLTASRTETEQLSANLKSLNSETASLELQKTEINSEITVHIKNAKTSRSEINSFLVKRRVLADELKALSVELDDVEANSSLETTKLDEVRSEAQRIENEKLSLEENVEKIKNRIQRTKTEIFDKKKLSTDMAQDKKIYEAQLEKLELEEMTHKEDLDSQEKILKQNKVDSESLLTYIEKLKASNENNEFLLDEMNKQRATLEKELHRLNDESSTVRQENSSSETRLSKVAGEVESIRNQVELKRTTVTETVSMKVEAGKKLKELSREKERLVEELRKKEHEVQRSVELLDNVSKEHEQVELEISKVSGQLDSFTERTNNHQSETEELTDIIHELSLVKADLLKSLETKKLESERANLDLRKKKVQLEIIQVDNFENENRSKALSERNEVLSQEIEQVDLEIVKKTTSLSSLCASQELQQESLDAIAKNIEDRKQELEAMILEEKELQLEISRKKELEIIKRKELREYNEFARKRSRALARRRMEVKSHEFNTQINTEPSERSNSKKLIANFESFVALNFFEVDLVIKDRENLESKSIPATLIRDYEKILRDFSNSMGIVKKLELSLDKDTMRLVIEGIEHSTSIDSSIEENKETEKQLRI